MKFGGLGDAWDGLKSLGGAASAKTQAGWRNIQGAGGAASAKTQAGWGHISGETARDNAAGKTGQLGDKITDVQGQEHTANEGVLANMDKGDTAYLGTAKKTAGDYLHTTDKVTDDRVADDKTYLGERRDALNSAKTQYNSTVEPRLKDLMERSGTEAKGAMTLAQASDPNNAVHKANEAKYNTLAQGAEKTGLADVGVLGALGAQNFAGQVGSAGIPMTGGQMASIYGANQNAASQAMFNTQKRMNDLKDQGIKTGYEQSDLAYGRGRDALDRSKSDVLSYANAGSAARDEQGNIGGQINSIGHDITDTKMGHARDTANVQMGVGGLEHQLGEAGSGRHLAENNNFYGGQIQGLGGQIQARTAQNESDAKSNSGLISAGAGIAGAAVGGPIGGVAAKGLADYFQGGNQPGTTAPQQGSMQYPTGPNGNVAAGPPVSYGSPLVGQSNPYDDTYNGAPRRAG